MYILFIHHNDHHVLALSAVQIILLELLHRLVLVKKTHTHMHAMHSLGALPYYNLVSSCFAQEQMSATK